MRGRKTLQVLGRSPRARRRIVREHGPEDPSQWAAFTTTASNFRCTSETLRNWVRQVEHDRGARRGLTTVERQRLKDLERDNQELCQRSSKTPQAWSSKSPTRDGCGR